MKNNKIAILLASYNGKKYIKEQIDSILNQKDVEVTIFISDDLSTDGTVEYLQDIYKDEKRLIYLESSQKFSGAAKNFYRLICDVDFSDFNYVAFADQDDIWVEDKLACAVKILDEKQADGYSSNVLAFWENGKERLINKAQKQVEYDYLFEAAGPGCTYVLNIKLATKLKNFIMQNRIKVDEVSLHDWFMYAFARANDYKWLIDEKVGLRYRQHIINQIGANNGLDAKIKRLKMIFSSWYRNETIKILNILKLENKYRFSKYIVDRKYINNLSLLININNMRRSKNDRIILILLILFRVY